jgi:hypothetical protein
LRAGVLVLREGDGVATALLRGKGDGSDLGGEGAGVESYGGRRVRRVVGTGGERRRTLLPPLLALQGVLVTLLPRDPVLGGEVLGGAVENRASELVSGQYERGGKRLTFPSGCEEGESGQYVVHMRERRRRAHVGFGTLSVSD